MLLDRIFSNKSRILILRELSLSEEGISNSQLSERTGLSEMAISRNIKDLSKSNLIENKRLGRNILSKINTKNNLGDALMQLFDWEKGVYSELGSIVKSDLLQEYPKSNLISIIVFGSRARKEEKLDSDMDILVLLKSGKKKNRTRFIEGILVSVFEISKKNFVEMSRNYNPLISNIILEGEAVYGKKEFKEIIKQTGF